MKDEGPKISTNCSIEHSHAALYKITYSFGLTVSPSSWYFYSKYEQHQYYIFQKISLQAVNKFRDWQIWKVSISYPFIMIGDSIEASN